MKLGLFNELINTTKENNFVQNFIKELSNYLENCDRKVDNQMKNETQKTNLREENVLYQVVDRGVNGIYLQNTKNNKIFEETNIPKELQDALGNDFILRYKNGEYVFEEQLTDDFFNSLVSIKEYEEIKNKFIEETNILDINSDAKFNIAFREEDYSILQYGIEKNDIIKVPNVLIPYFINSDTILKYEDGKFKKVFK
ncbi:MAG: hypothetical protein IJH39_08865 [Clostridia bacterium]|nr:hypothetical protein [Clostridia bacterium]